MAGRARRRSAGTVSVRRGGRPGTLQVGDQAGGRAGAIVPGCGEAGLLEWATTAPGLECTVNHFETGVWKCAGRLLSASGAEPIWCGGGRGNVR